MSWFDFSRDRFKALPKLATPAGNTFGRGLLFTWDKRDSPKQNTCSSARVKMRKKHVHHAFLKLSNQIKCDRVMHIPSWCFANLWNWCLLLMLSLLPWSIKLLLRSKFTVKFVTKTLSFQLIRSGCTCFGHSNELWRPLSENIELENVGFSRPPLQIYVPVSPWSGVAVL